MVSEEKTLKENYFVRFEKKETGNAGQVQQSNPPTIAFSKDEKTIRVKYDKGEWTFHRPVVTLWDFKPSGKALWVAPSGNDANDGSTEKPFRTIGMAPMSRASSSRSLARKESRSSSVAPPATWAK